VLRAAGLLAMALAASTTLTACDTSPYAARVNGYVITQSSLNGQLKGWASNKAWVGEYNSQNSVENGGSGTTVEGTGGSGTFSTTFSAGILDGLIATTALGQSLSTAGSLPDADMEVAARGVREAELGTTWTGWPPYVRQYIVDELAYQAALLHSVTISSTDKQAYQQFQPYIFYRLCVQQASAFTRAEAEAISSSGSFTGVQICYDQLALENESPAFFAAVVQLTVGKVSQPIPTKYGYEVAKLVSKSSPPFNQSVAKVVAVSVDSTVAEAPVTKILTSASVKVNPQYGTWSSGTLNPPTGSGS
jgi:hypothetical protein